MKNKLITFLMTGALLVGGNSHAQAAPEAVNRPACSAIIYSGRLYVDIYRFPEGVSYFTYDGSTSRMKRAGSYTFYVDAGVSSVDIVDDDGFQWCYADEHIPTG
jgi:hypothetical protein